MSYKVHHGDVETVLAIEYPENHFDAVLCDPPYGLSFMGRTWDYRVPQAALWREVLRVCKPGAALIAFSGTRTYHRSAVQIEDAGWEIRDQIAWGYGSGFPKSLDVGKAIDKAAASARLKNGEPDYEHEHGKYSAVVHAPVTAPATDAAHKWSGYGTALKPAWEPAVLARKPLEGTVAENVARWGVGALAIDASRVGTGADKTPSPTSRGDSFSWFTTTTRDNLGGDDSKGRWPANVILDAEAGAALDEQSGALKSGGPSYRCGMGYSGSRFDKTPIAHYGDSGGASRFFYCAKASKRERGEGNAHPTVKPLDLMRYLSRLIMPPKPVRILVPFAGSGSEMIGCMLAGWPEVIGIEREEEYVQIARARLALHAAKVAA